MILNSSHLRAALVLYGTSLDSNSFQETYLDWSFVLWFCYFVNETCLFKVIAYYRDIIPIVIVGMKYIVIVILALSPNTS